MLRISLLLAVFFALTQNLVAQSVSGIINQYYPVTAIDYCANQVTVASVSGLSVGQKLLLIQMQGVTMDITNTAAFGTITTYGDAGNHEFVYISAISGNVLSIQYPLLNTYSPGNGVQLVTVPNYTTVSVSGVLTCQAWNGTTGGVLVLEAGTINLNANIDVSHKGFRGGKDSLSNFACSWSLVQTAFSYGFNLTPFGRGAIKGEGVRAIITNYECGKGAQANGGGGANDHNAGGAGGGNLGAGGNGGNNQENRFFYCKGQHPGVGGRALVYNNVVNKVFMGGGGGAGHRNNHPEYPSAGGNGGGIVLLRANTLNGNGYTIRANGNWVDSTYNDGAGGGGAGGAILLEVNNFPGNLTLRVQGGDGGKLVSDPGQCMGPGGGGAGGVIWVSGASLLGTVSSFTNGGIAGFNFLWSDPSTCFGNSNGATAGANGAILYNLQLNENLTIPSGSYIWTGAENTDWFNACNWNLLSVPNQLSDVIIPGSLSSGNYPLISGGVGRCATIEIDADNGAEVTIDTNTGGYLEVY